VSVTIRLFVSSTSFGLVTAAIYWATTREYVGTVLLGLFGIGFGFVSAYLAKIRRKTRLDGDSDRAPAELAGERIGVFSLESPWPVLLAICTAALLIGIVLHPMLALLAAICFGATLWQLVRESV
jgi:Cytochrome c oxidase subunit IV